MKHHTEEHVNKEIDSKEAINIVIEPTTEQSLALIKMESYK